MVYRKKGLEKTITIWKDRKESTNTHWGTITYEQFCKLTSEEINEDGYRHTFVAVNGNECCIMEEKGE